MGMLETIVGAFSPGGVLGAQQRRADIEATQQQTQMRKQQAAQQDEEFHAGVLHRLMDEGALPVGPGGIVRRTAYNPGNPNLGTAATGGIPGMPGLPAGVGPTSGSYFDKADPSRVITHKSPDGQVFQFELPTEADKTNKSLWRAITEHMNPAVRQARDYGNQNAQQAAQATAQGTAAGRNAAESQRRDAEGIPVPPALDAQLPGISTGPNGQPRKVLPGAELDNLITSAGRYADLTSKAANRKTVMKSEITRDDQGNQVQVNTLNDGSVVETPLNAKGVTAKTPNTVSPYQQWQMNRQTNNDAVQRVNVWQNKLDKLQSQSEALWAHKKSADDEVEALNQQLNAKTTGILGSGIGSGPALKAPERLKLQVRINTLKRSSADAAAQAEDIDSQKRIADTVRRSIMTANGLDGSAGKAAGGPAGSAPAPSRSQPLPESAPGAAPPFPTTTSGAGPTAVPSAKVHVKTSKGIGYIPKANLAAAQKLDPSIQVIP